MASFDVSSKPIWLKGTSASIFKLPIVQFVADLSEQSFDECISMNTGFSSSSNAEAACQSEPMVVSSLVPTCIACGQVFASRSEQVEHFKSDSHRLKLSERVNQDDDINSGQQPSSSHHVKNNDESDESGDDEEDEDNDDEDQTAEYYEANQVSLREKGWWLRKGYPTLCFSSKRHKHWAVELSVSLFAKSRKELIYDESEDNIVKPSLYSLTASSHSNATWCIILMRSGRFAAGIYQGDSLVKHKVFKRYTTRKGQGGSQSSMDATGKKPKSAGAMLRRHGEEQLREDSRRLLRDEWGGHLKNCQFIFYAVPRTMLPILFNHSGPNNKDAPLDRDDMRLRPTSSCNKPSLEEVKNIHKKLSTVEFYDIDNPKKSVESVLPVSASQSTIMTKPESSISQKSKIISTNNEVKTNDLAPEEVIQKLPNPVFEAIALKDLEKLKDVLKNNQEVSEDGGSVLFSLSDMLASTDINGSTALHLACQENRPELVQVLLESGSDPSLLDSHLRPPFYLTSSKEVRDTFRRYRAHHLDQWDWVKSQVPEPLTDELIDKKKEKEREKKKRQREREKLKKKEAQEVAAKEREEKEKQAEEERQAQLKLDEAIRLGSICDGCGGPIKKGNVFTRLSYKYCSSGCSQAHRRALMCEAAESRMKK